MPKQRSGRSSRDRGAGTARRGSGKSGSGKSGSGKFGRRQTGASGSPALAVALLAVLALVGGYLYLHTSPHPSTVKGPPPSPEVVPHTAPAPHPAASPTTPGAPPAAAARPTPTPPFGINEDVFESGAHLYGAHCASCHGTPTADAANIDPGQQLWRKGRHLVTAPAPGHLFTEISAGNPSKGMPAYAQTLTETQIWQLALLLNNAGQELPDPVLHILNTPHRR